MMYFGVRDHPHLDGVGDHDPFNMGADHARDRCGIAGRLDDDNIFPRQSRGKRRKQIAAHVDATEPSEFAVLLGDGLGKSSVYIKANVGMPLSLIGSSIKRELAGNTTSTDPRSQRIRESRKGRPCNELGLSALY